MMKGDERMTKILRIANCSECKWRQISAFEVLCRGRSGADRIITDKYGGQTRAIPHWCPLEDAPTPCDDDPRQAPLS